MASSPAEMAIFARGGARRLCGRGRGRKSVAFRGGKAHHPIGAAPRGAAHQSDDAAAGADCRGRDLSRSRPSLGAIEAAESEVASARGSPRGHLRVHTFPVIAAHELAPALPEFLARHPHITFDFMVTHRSVDLVGKNVDVSLRIGPLEDSGLVARKIVDLSRLICASPDRTSNSVNNTRTRLGGGKQLPRLDRFARKADSLLPAEEREQDLDPLVRLHAGVDPKLSSERPDRDLHARAHARTAGLGEFNQPVTLA